MTINVSLLKFYPPVNATDPASSGYGGDANIAATQTSGQLGNEFRDVTNEERISGLIDYRKQFLRNENADTWESVKVWVSQNTLAPDDTVDICQAGTLSLLGATSLLGAASYVTTATVLNFAFDPHLAVRPGEWVYSVTNDATMASPKEVATVTNSTVVLVEAFGTSTADPDTIAICPATMFTFSSPASKSVGKFVGDVASNNAVGVWKRRTVSPNAAGYTNNSFIVTWESR